MTSLRSHGAALVLALLALGAAAPRHETGPVANEPYRHLPATSPAALPATAARAVLATASGRTTRGLIVTSAERGPQVSLFIPPGAFTVEGGSGDVVVEVVPEVPSGARVPGKAVSNGYALRARSSAGPVGVTPGVQPMTITLRGFEAESMVVTVLYRPTADRSWRALPTRELGAHVHHASVPGLGEFVLSAVPVHHSGGRTWLWSVAGLAALLLLALSGRALTHRLSSSRQGGLA